MDIWGTGPFENEAGAAFADEVVQDGAFALAEAFDVALDPDTDFLAAEEGWRTLAAAEILAAALDGDTLNLVSARLRVWVQEATRRTSPRCATWRVMPWTASWVRTARCRTCGPTAPRPTNGWAQHRPCGRGWTVEKMNRGSSPTVHFQLSP
ncbi:hypothetical protein GCM10010840_22060 [Deinococcus aerolatus]|uniref:DUF4259 domain-containing protein n=1 Tax=Deinococcus aerolatus TaxID=522487 RepID=A0ABQ2GAM0_9DEIO|nr:hypothetical protein GCM10010840_22060 [Deinococcus aerolatus]